MRSIREMLHKTGHAAAPSMGMRLLLYWFAMALLLVATILSILMATGVLSHASRQLAGVLDIQQRNTYAALDAQMNTLTAQGMAMSEKLGKELDAFLAVKGISFGELNDNPAAIAELEKRLYLPLNSTLSAAACSGTFFCLHATANTSLPNADDLRAGMYLRYSGLQPTVASEQDIICFRGATEAARGLQLQMHNRWNPVLLFDEPTSALEPGAERRADPRQSEGLRLSGAAAGGGLPVDEAHGAAGYMGAGHAAVRTHSGRRRRGARVLRYGGQRSLFQPLPRHGVQHLRQDADAGGAGGRR